MLEKINILIVEDDETTSYLMQDFLEENNFKVDVVYTVTDGISYLKNRKYDILLLDLNLPDFNGFELLSSIKNHISIPIIITSAYNETSTKVKAFKYGANDYLSKPIDFLELEARIWALLSRSEKIKIKSNNDEIFKIENNKILFKNNSLVLTSLEYDILSFFINNKNITISRERLTDFVSSVKSHRLLDNHIKNIRKKIEEDSTNPTYLKTEYGIGYRLVIASLYR
ncbi:MAG: response regulator transcription factor [Campylobacterota bacterium]|nr:response regulator transcription factor [Campylobacterota bacterium]